MQSTHQRRKTEPPQQDHNDRVGLQQSLSCDPPPASPLRSEPQSNHNVFVCASLTHHFSVEIIQEDTGLHMLQPVSQQVSSHLRLMRIRPATWPFERGITSSLVIPVMSAPDKSRDQSPAHQCHQCTSVNQSMILSLRHAIQQRAHTPVVNNFT